MPGFAEEFDDKFQKARQRILPRRDHKKLNGKAASEVEAHGEYVAPNATPGVSLDDFYAYMPMHSYIYAPSREMWPASSINARLPPIPISAD